MKDWCWGEGAHIRGASQELETMWAKGLDS